MLGWQKVSFDNFLKLNASGVSEYTMEQIKAKSATVGLTESLTTQAIALGKDADFTSKISTGKVTFGKALKDNIGTVDELTDALKKSGKINEKSLKYLEDGLSQGGDVARKRLESIITSTEGVADSIIDLGTVSTQTSTGISAAFTGMAASAKTLFTTLATNPITWAAAAAVAVVALEDAFTVDYTEANESLRESSQKYQETKNNLESLNSELEKTQSRITELQSLKDAGTISFAEEAELEKLQSQNAELERKIQLQEKLSTIQSKGIIADAKEAMSKEDYSVAQSVKMGDSEGKKKFRDEVGKVTDTQAIRDDLALISEYETELPKLEEKVAQLKKETSGMSLFDDGYIRKNLELDDAEKQLKKYQDSINTLYSDLDFRAESVQTQLDALKMDPDVNFDEIRELEKALNSINNIDLSPTEQALNSLNSFFDGSTGKNFIKESLSDAARDGKNLEKVLSELGLELSDLGDGVNLDTLNRYFEDITKSANEASDAINKVNNNLTMKDIGTAFESENAGDDYVSLNDYLKKAKDLYDKGLVGTDDFKSVAEAISYNIDSSTESFIANYNKLQRYFTEDDNGNLTGQGINNFLTDLEALGKGYAKWNDETGKWDINMDNTAQAAKDLEVSVQTMEAVLGRIKDYDNLGDFNFRSAIDDFENAKSSLEGLRDIYEELQDGNDKKRLGKKLEGWESQVETWENDLATLDTDVVMNIKLEYDLATIQSQIDDVQALIDAGANNVDNNAQVIAGNDKYISTAREGLGLDNEGVKIPVEYEANEESIAALKTQLKNATSDKDKVKIQAEIENLQDIQKQLLDKFSEVHPEINVESSPDEVNKALESFISSAEGKEIVAKITADDKEAKNKVSELLGNDPNDITVDINANDNASNVITSILSELMGIPEEKISELIVNDNASDVVIGVLASLSGIPAETLTAINATDGASGVITYVLSEILGIPEEKVTELLAKDEASKIAKQVTSAINKVPDKHDTTLKALDNASPAANMVRSAINSIPNSKTITISAVVSSSVNNAVNTVKNVMSNLHGGKAGLSGTAHRFGTLDNPYPTPGLSRHALAMGTLRDDSWLKPQWETKESNIALTGEEAPELVVDRYSNTWWTVGDRGAEFAAIPKGAIVFNGKQTKELFKNGFINSRGTAYLGGTAYAGGASGSFSFGGGASQYNKPLSSSSKNNKKKPTSSTSTTTPSTNTAESISDTNEEAEKFEETLDAIDILINRIERQIKNLERIAGSAFNTFEKRTNALREQMSSITQEISIQQQGYERYLQEANSVELSEDYKNLVRNGAIDISTITDEDLSKNIQEFQEW